MSTLKDKVCEMPHDKFQETILKNVVPTAEYQKFYNRGPNTLTKEEKENLAKVILANIDKNDIKLPINTNDLISFVVATTIRMAKHI